MTRRALVVPVAIVAATVVAAMVVLIAGGPHRGAVAMALLIGVPLLLAMGGGSDEGWRAAPATSDVRPGIRLAAFLPVTLFQVIALVTVAWLVIALAAGGDVVYAVAIVPFAMLAGWRVWQISLRLRASR